MLNARKRLKRKFDQEFEKTSERDCKSAMVIESPCKGDPKAEIRAFVEALSSTDRAILRIATDGLADLASDVELLDAIVDCGAIPALVRNLQSPELLSGDPNFSSHEHQVEKKSAVALGQIAIKAEYQQLIVDAGAVPRLVNMLSGHKICPQCRAVNGAIRRAADVITNLAHENFRIKTEVRIEGGIPPLVELLVFSDVKVQRAAAGALRTLAFKNNENKNQILDFNALPTLVLMLRSANSSIHSEAIGVIGNLVHSSPTIKKVVLLAGALQPIIALLSSNCSETQREAALLLGQFASADSDCKVHIVQRGAVRPLIGMLQSQDVQLKEMSTFALGRLAQDTHNQAGIVQEGAMQPLVGLLDSKTGSLQHNAAFALYGLADNEDNAAEFLKIGAFEKLQHGEFFAQPTKDCVARTLKRLQDKVNGRVLNHLIYVMRDSDQVTQKRVALALAHLCSPQDSKAIFLDNKGLELLLELLDSRSLKQQQSSSAALLRLVTISGFFSLGDPAPILPSQVSLGEKYVNNPAKSDITFLIEGKRFYAHRICLLASSDAFRAMFQGGYREKDAQAVVIPNISCDVFELMMRYIYTGFVDFDLDTAQDLLIAADQYLIEGLKQLCECRISQNITSDNLSDIYEFSCAHNARQLKKSCVLFVLERFGKHFGTPWYAKFAKRIIPDIRDCILEILSYPMQAEQED